MARADAEAALEGREADPSGHFRGGGGAPRSRDAKPVGDNAFKIELARRVVARALRLAAAGTPQDAPALPASPFGACPMTEIALSRDPAHARHGSNAGQPLTRLDGPLKGDRPRDLRRRRPSRRVCCTP